MIGCDVFGLSMYEVGNMSFDEFIEHSEIYSELHKFSKYKNSEDIKVFDVGFGGSIDNI